MGTFFAAPLFTKSHGNLFCSSSHSLNMHGNLFCSSVDANDACSAANRHPVQPAMVVVGDFVVGDVVGDFVGDFVVGDVVGDFVGDFVVGDVVVCFADRFADLLPVGSGDAEGSDDTVGLSELLDRFADLLPVGSGDAEGSDDTVGLSELLDRFADLLPVGSGDAEGSDDTVAFNASICSYSIPARLNDPSRDMDPKSSFSLHPPWMPKATIIAAETMQLVIFIVLELFCEMGIVTLKTMMSEIMVGSDEKSGMVPFRSPQRKQESTHSGSPKIHVSQFPFLHFLRNT
jgi:hypothetical protein